MTVVVFKEIKPKRLKDEALRKELLKGIEKTGKDIKSDYEKTTKTWQHKPTFIIESSLDPKGPEVLVGTDDEIYGYVDRGTSVRRALMTNDFSPKTKKGVIGSSSGRGGVVYVDKRLSLPGIEARDFSKTIEKKHQPRFKRAMESALSAGAKKSGHSL